MSSGSVRIGMNLQEGSRCAVAAFVVGPIVYMILEGWAELDSLCISVVTLAAVQFGDLHPTTDPAKTFTIVYIITGLGIRAAFGSESRSPPGS